MIKLYSGNTLVIPILINSPDITDLTGAKIVFSAKHRGTPELEIIKTPTVEGMVVTVELTSAETLVDGVYTLEFRGVFSGITKTLDYDTLLITHANFTEVI